MRIFATLAIGAWALSARGGQDFKYDYWESWNSFEAGSLVEFELEMSGTKMTITKTLDKKEEEKILVKTLTKMTFGDNVTETPGEEPINKPKKGDPSYGDGECPLCKKPAKEHKDGGTWEKDVALKIGEEEVKCVLYTVGDKLCTGEDNPGKGTKTWYSKDVPGWLVKMEQPQMKMTATKFESKKKKEEK